MLETVYAIGLAAVCSGWGRGYKSCQYRVNARCAEPRYFAPRPLELLSAITLGTTWRRLEKLPGKP